MKPAVALGAEMTAREVLIRLAEQGFWTAPDHPAAAARIARIAARLKQPVDEVACRLVHDPDHHGAAVRRQWGSRVLWYARELREVLERCAAAPPDEPLLDVLNLHEGDAQPVIQIQRDSETALSHGVVMDDGRPVGVSFGGSKKGSPQTEPMPTQPERAEDILPGPSRAPTANGPIGKTGPAPIEPTPTPPGRAEDFVSRGASRTPAAASPSQPEAVPVWPRIEAPQMVPAKQVFDVVVGFGAAQQAGVVGGRVVIPAPPGVGKIQLSVELSAGPELQAPAGWIRPLTVQLDDLPSASVTFQLVGAEPADPGKPSLTMLEVRYVLAGTICGIAAKPIAVLSSNGQAARASSPHLAWPDEEWQMTPATATPIVLIADEFAPDLTIEITKPDRNAASGAYMCQLCSPHALTTPRGPFQMDLGQDAKTYAKSIVEEVRVFAGNAMLDNTLEAIGRTVSQCLPREAFDALTEVAKRVAPAAPAVLIVSAEPFVPWELAWVEPPLDPALPHYLGAQAVVGRWLRDSDATAGTGGVPRPATQPVARLTVQNMAVMAAFYKSETGLRKLVQAEKEAQELVALYSGVPLAATSQAMRQLLNATLEYNFKTIGGPDAVHFAGHGDFDPNRPEASALFLQDGLPLRSTVFRSAKYGGERQPLMFLNACMLGIGGELLGDMAGFPGNSLRGGFGGVLGALWEVDDVLAREFALEFWRRALPPSPAQGEPIGKILQDLRKNYLLNGSEAPISTYLSYVYYGHPRLRLQRAA